MLPDHDRQILVEVVEEKGRLVGGSRTIANLCSLGGGLKLVNPFFCIIEA